MNMTDFITPEADAEGRIMGVDFGEVRVGLSLSDPTRRLASPLPTLQRRRGKRAPVQAMVDLVREHDVRGVVFGLPLELSGEEGPWAREVREFGLRVGERSGVPVYFVDERLSSVVAERHVRSSGLPRGKREQKGRVDAAAAVLILQRWLDEFRRRPNLATGGLPEQDPRPKSTGLCLVATLAVTALMGCGLVEPQGRSMETVARDETAVVITVPQGASFRQVTDTLVARGLVSQPRLFRGWARWKGEDSRVRAGTYALDPAGSWTEILETLVAGRVVTEPVTFPEGWTLRQIAGRIAAFTGASEEAVLDLLLAENAEDRWGVPGPGLEGYLFPDTYRFAPGVPLESVVEAMIRRYRQAWTEERRQRAMEIGMSEQQIMTLASIVQAEARHFHEMPRISAVFHNRLRIGYLLQADPTVQYALGERRSRLLYRDIDAVADHPYNTYTQRGLPPGPIGAAGEDALDATLWPEDSSYLYFVARPDGTHIFTRTLVEHNRARVEARRQWDAIGSRGGGL
jgi:UPF0755 protein